MPSAAWSPCRTSALTGPTTATDLNDLHLARGLDAVRRCVDAALLPAEEAEC